MGSDSQAIHAITVTDSINHGAYSKKRKGQWEAQAGIYNNVQWEAQAGIYNNVAGIYNNVQHLLSKIPVDVLPWPSWGHGK